MHEIVELQTYFYLMEKMGIGQMCVLCGSVVLPRVEYESDLQRAANELFRINDSLRTRFIECEDGKVRQEIEPFKEQKFDVLRFDSWDDMNKWANIYATIPLKLDIRSEGKGIPKEAWSTGAPTPPAMIAHALAHNVATAYKTVRLGLKQKPTCCEVKLVQLPGSTGAIIKMHHIVSDAWSMAVLARQFVQLLNGEQPVAYQYEEHIRNDEKYRQSKSYQRDIAFFKKQLEYLPESRPLWDKPVTSMVAKRRTKTLDEGLTSQIREYAAGHAISPYIVFLTAAGVYVRRKLETDRFYFVSVCGNRNGIHERNMVGLFVNSPMLLMDMDGNDTFEQATKKVNEANFTCYRHQRAAGTILKDFDTTTRTSLLMSYQDATLDVDPSVVCSQHYCDYLPYFSLSIEDRAAEGRFKLHLDCNLQKVPVEESEELLNCVANVLRNATADDSKTIDELSK